MADRCWVFDCKRCESTHTFSATSADCTSRLIFVLSRPTFAAYSDNPPFWPRPPFDKPTQCRSRGLNEPSKPLGVKSRHHRLRVQAGQGAANLKVGRSYPALILPARGVMQRMCQYRVPSSITASACASSRRSSWSTRWSRKRPKARLARSPRRW